MKNNHKIIVLGVGNVLLKDEGVGVRMIERLRKKYDFPPHVDAVDGGTLGLSLLSIIDRADRLLVVDAIKNRGNPGDTYRFDFDDIPYALRQKNSLHQADLMECLKLIEFVGTRPETVIVGVEPEDISPYGVELTPSVRASMDRLETMILQELERWGERLSPRESGGGEDAGEPDQWGPRSTNVREPS